MPLSTVLSLLGAAWPGILTGYLMGSLSFAVIISRLTQGKDVRSEGSGNAGMTNMLRTFGWSAAIQTLLGDLLKGVLSVLLARALSPPEWTLYAGYLGGLSAVIGHMKPVFFGFKGGKGIATGIGALFALDPLAALIVVAYAVPLIALSGYVSLGSITGAIGAPIIVSALRLRQGRFDPLELLLLLLLVALVLYAHRENIARLHSGTERKFHHKKTKPEEEPDA